MEGLVGTFLEDFELVGSWCSFVLSCDVHVCCVCKSRGVVCARAHNVSGHARVCMYSVCMCVDVCVDCICMCVDECVDCICMCMCIYSVCI